MTYEIGQFLNNEFEVSHNAVTIEIVASWVDPEDEAVYYLVKCREVSRTNTDLMYSAWYYEDEIDLVCEGHLDKYYNLES